jgi:hypothetical protein
MFTVISFSGDAERPFGRIREIMQRFALLPWGDENWVPSAGWRVRAGAGWGFAVVRVAVAGAEGAQWWRRAACRHCSRLDRSRP